MKRRILTHPYRNSFSGPEFPIETGPFMEIPKRTFEYFYFMHDSHDKLWFSTSKGFNFVKVDVFDPFHIFSAPVLDKFLNEYSYYNCTKETGTGISFWIDIGDISYSEYEKLKSEYLSEKKLNYTTFVKQYLNLPPLNKN